LNRSSDPVKEMVLVGKIKAVSWMEVEFKEFLACKLDSWQYIPHMQDMENIKELLGMLSPMWRPRAAC